MINKTIKEIMELLKSAGIKGIDDEKTKLVQASYDSLPEGFKEDIDENAMIAIALMQLSLHLNESNNNSNTSNSVYCFDAEIDDISKMFTDVLKGIVSLNNDEFTITQIKETQNEMNDDGSGRQTIEFNYNDKPYVYEGKLSYDWFDAGFFEFFNNVLEIENNPKRLHVTTDGTQIVILFYNTNEWAEEFSNKTGLEFMKQ